MGPNENNEENSQIEITYNNVFFCFLFFQQIPFALFCPEYFCRIFFLRTWKLLATICFDHVHGNYC